MTGSIGERFLHDGAAAEGGFASPDSRAERAKPESARGLASYAYQHIDFDLQHAGMRLGSCCACSNSQTQPRPDVVVTVGWPPHQLRRAAVLGCCSIFLTEPAFAYLDPGSVSLALQAIVAGIAGALLTWKYWWHRLMKLLGLARASESEKPESAEDKNGADANSGE